jgi:adenylate cyclase
VRLCLVSGGAGIGKSRLLHEFFARLEADPARRTLVVRAQPASAAPYGAWVALLQRLFLVPGGTRFDATQVTDQLAALAAPLEEPKRSELLSQAPVVSFLLGLVGHDPSENLAPAELQSRIQQTLVLTLEAISRRSLESNKGRPALIALDNVHRADAVSLEMLGKVLGALRVPSPPVVIVAVREAEPPKLPESVVVTRVKLGPMREDEVRAIAASIADEGLSPDVEQLVLERAAGNPLFVEELVLALREQGITNADAAALRRFAPPTSLFGLILSRVDRLDPELRAALRYASVLGMEFSVALFEAVVASLDDEHASRQHLVELEHRGILARRIEQREEIVAFRQVLARDAVYSTVLRENKRVLHELAAAAIERLYADRLAAYVPTLLIHYSQTDKVDRAVHYARLAGRRALALGAFADAVEALMMAATLQGRMDQGDPLPPAITLLDLATALFWSGRIQEAADRVQESQELLEGDEREEALTVRARCTMLRAETDYHLARWSEGLSHLEAAEELFRRAGRPFDAAQVACTRGFQLRSLGRLDEGLALARRGWETLKDSNDLPAVVRAGHDLGNILRDVGEYSAAIKVFDRAVEVGDALAKAGSTSAAIWGRFGARSGRAMTFASMGRLAEAIEEQSAVYALALAEGSQVVQATAGYHLAHHLVDHGELDKAEEVALRSLRTSNELGLQAREMKCRMLLAQIAEHRGRAAAALTHLEAAETLARQSQVGDEAWLDVAEHLLAALRAQGGLERAEELLWEARARADRNANPLFRVRVAVLEAQG